jgi:hypothetical protein
MRLRNNKVRIDRALACFSYVNKLYQNTKEEHKPATAPRTLVSSGECHSALARRPERGHELVRTIFAIGFISAKIGQSSSPDSGGSTSTSTSGMGGTRSRAVRGRCAPARSGAARLESFLLPISLILPDAATDTSPEP